MGLRTPFVAAVIVTPLLLILVLPAVHAPSTVHAQPTVVLSAAEQSARDTTFPKSSAPEPSQTDNDSAEPVTWGSGETPFGLNAYFATADGCQSCHGGSDDALALRDSLGRDVSPWSLWQSGMHANAARDPFYRAQAVLESGRIASATDRTALEDSCLACHSPMVYHAARLDGRVAPAPSVTDSLGGRPDSLGGLVAALSDPLGLDGVSCTSCHAASPNGWEGDAFFDGKIPYDKNRRLYGPHASPSAGPMVAHTAFTPAAGPHMKKSELCGSCHTYRIGAEKLLVSSSYLEWRATDPASRQECQECHFQPSHDRRIARSPLGRDFNLARRAAVGSHGSIGGNAYVLDLLRHNADELEVEAPLDDLRRAATAARVALLDRTAELEISEISRRDGSLLFDVRIENRTGHKLPTGFPSRRMWLMVEVRVGGQEVFVTGNVDETGRLVGIEEAALHPHRDVVRTPNHVPIYEAVPADSDGRPVTRLTQATQFAKDNRILPAGWWEGGPDGAATAPIGVGADPSFVAGHDVVRFELDVLTGTRGKATVIARLFYQAIPPRWIDTHRESQSVASKQFSRITKNTPPIPEVLGMRVRFE